MRILNLLIVLVVFPAVCFADTINIPADYPTIQQGIGAALGGDTVLVEPGTYVENIDFLGKAISVTSSGGIVMTVIDGNQAGSVVSFSSGESYDSVLDGFTITNGNGTLGPYGWICGGGLYINNSNPTVMNCLFNAKTLTAGYGGGMCNLDCSPAVTDCIFTGNQAPEGGGAGCLTIMRVRQ